jgi:RNA polymerase sigma-70 factor, ECF subfamily
MTSRRSGEPYSCPDVWGGPPNLSVSAGETCELNPAEHTEIVDDLANQDSSDLDILFDRYSRLVLGTAFRVLGDPSEAEEIVQEVFFYLYRKPNLFDPSKGSLKAWIIQITFCRALDRKLYLARRRLVTHADIDSLELRGQTNLEHQIEAKLSRKHLERALADLTQMQRQTVELFYFEGFGLREIGQQLQQPLGTVRHHLYRGLERLRKSSLLNALVCK